MLNLLLKYGVPDQVKGSGLIKTLILKTLGKGWLMINQRARGTALDYDLVYSRIDLLMKVSRKDYNGIRDKIKREREKKGEREKCRHFCISELD